jgi:hypothetical protein
MPTFQEIYNKHNDAIAQGLISPDESLSTFAQRGYQVTGDPSYKNVADSGWFSNAIRSRSADLSNFVESGPVDEWTSEAVGRIGDLFGITPESSRAMGKKLPRMVVDFLPMMVGAAFAAPTGGASLLPALGMAGTSVLSAASSYEDSGRPIDAIIGGAVPYLGTKLAQVGSAAALRAAEKSKFLNRLGIQGGTTEVGAALNAAEKAQLASQGLSAPVIGATTVDRTVVKSLADKAFGYGAGQAAANAGFFGLDTLRYGPETTFTKDYAFNSLIGNLAFGLADLPRAFRPTVVSSRFNVPKAQDVYLTPGEERMHRALAMFKDLEDPRQIESLKRQYGLDIANIELNTEKLRTAQYLRTEEAQAEKQNFATKWNEFLDTDPLFNQATNGAFKITQGGAFGKDLVNFDAVMNAENLPPKAQVIVDAYKQKAQNVKARYTSAVNSLADGANLYDGLQRSVEEMGLDQFVRTPVEQRDYHKALKDSFLSPEGIDLVRDIQRKEANLEPLNPELFQEFMDFYSGKRTDLDFDRRADMAVAVSLARGAVPKLKEAKVKAKIAEQEGQKLQDVVEAGLKPVEEQARKLVIDSTPYQELQAKIAQDEAERLRLEAEDELNKTKMEIQRSTDVTVRQAAYERLKVQQVELAKRERDVAAAATVYLNAQKQQRDFVARAEAAKKAGQVVEPVVAPVKATQPKVETAPEEFLNNVDEETPVVSWYEQDTEAQINALTATARIKKNEGEAQRLVEVELKKLSQQQKKDLAEMLGVKPSEIAVSIVNDRGQMGYGAEARFEDSFTKGVRLASNGKGESFLIPVPDGDYQTVKPFAEALLKKVAPKEAQGRVEELVTLAKFFNNPEVVYAELKGLKEGKGDAQFARASAGAFDFGMREVKDGKLVRPGKPPLGTKDGWMTELEFRVNGGDLGPLQKDEVAFYKQLVPEAFADGKVHLQKLWDGLNKVGESVKVDVYGQDGDVSPVKVELDTVEGELDILDSAWQENYVTEWQKDSLGRRTQAVLKTETPANVRSLVERRNRAQALYEAPKQELPKATSYYNSISPFDTKKYPVVRVDVWLPRQKELWKQDNLHENLPNTLGWAMVQFVPDPRTGETVAFVVEQQSRWGQEYQKLDQKAKLHEKARSGMPGADKPVARERAEELSQPLLESQANLVLKAVIREAQKRGVKKVVVSDGETAMMTEGHDTAVNLTPVAPKGEYDLPEWRNQIELAPGEVSNGKFKITSEGILAQSESGRWLIDINDINATRLREITTSLNAKFGVVPRPSQEGGMRLAYDTTLPSVMKKLTGGEGEMWNGGVHKNAYEQRAGDEYHNEFMRTLPPKGSPVFRNPDGTPKSSVTGRIYDISNPSERVGTLFAQNAGKVYGAASFAAKKIFINSKAFDGLNPAQRVGFVFAHEHAHIAIEKAKSGIYGPEAQVRAELAEKWVMTADPQAKQVVRDVLMDLHLPKEIRDSEGVKDVLQNMEPNEWLANAMGMYAVGMVKPSRPKMAFSLLPRPIREFFEWGVKSMQNLTKAAKLWFKLRGDKAQYQQAKNVQSLMDSIRRSYRQAEWDAAEAEAFLRVQPEDMIEKATDLQFAKVSPSARTGGAVFKEEPVKWMKGVFDAWNNPLHTLARLHKAFVEPVLSVHQKHDRITNGIMEVEKTFFGGLSASGKVQIDSKAHERVFGSMPLKTLLNDIQRFAVQENKRVIQEGSQPNTLEVNLGNLSPELRGKFAQFKPEAQQALVQVLASFEMANRKSQEIFKTGFLRESTARLAQMMQFKSSFNKADFGKAPEIAKGIMTDLLNGDPVLARSKLDMMDPMEADKLIESAQLLAQQHVKLADYYAKHPSYMSFRRFKKHKQRMEKPGVADDVVDADTPGELQRVVAEQVAKGWKVKGDPMVQDKKSKEQYRMNDELLQLIRQHDSEMLENMKTQGLTADQFDSLASMLNTEDLVARQINAKELYKPMGLRKFSGDLERFDALEQFMRYTPAAIHAVESRATEAEVNFGLQNPALRDLQTEKDQFKALYEQSKTLDPEWARKLAKANAVWHIGWNLPGHIAETAQPFLSHLPELIARGDGAVKGLARIFRAGKEMLNVQRVRTKGIFSKDKVAKFEHAGEKFEGIPAAWLQANGTKGDNLEIARALETLSNRIQRAPMSEILNSFDSKAHTQLERLSRGEPLAKLGEIVAKPFNMYVKGSMTFYSQFPMHNAVVAIVSSYRQAREQGFSPKDAIAKAELFDLSVNNSSGRLERPEMFNKLGGAGHLVYQLSSYVRGRFADLATFYRHGWSDDQYNLTPAEKKNARKAFQTMILAQVGAAGLLGMPFVGAGIALMEELLGEDIKGRMYEALDEVTNDPSLTHALTHGFASAFAENLGIPADMHSRFALSGFLGTNAYDGMSAKSFMGPSVAMLDSLWKLGGTMAQGKSVEEALTVGGPGGVKRLAEALSEDFQRDNPEASLAWSALGFRSTQMTKRKEFGRIVDRREMESRRELELAANRISDTLANPATARKTLFDEAMKLVPSGLNPLEQKQQLQQNIKDLAAKVSLLEANKVAPEDLRTQIAGRVAPQVANVGRSMGVQMNDPMELARSLATQKTRSVLGQPLSQRPVRNAMMRDLQWGTNPWEF